MAEEIKKIYARIGGMSYHLVTSENELYTRQIAAKADEMINRVMQNNPQLSQNMATVLALVNAVDELNSLYAKQSAVDSQKQEMEKQSGDIRKELMRLREQNWEMKKEILRLNDLCQDYQALITKLTTPGEPVRTDILDDARLAKLAAAPDADTGSVKKTTATVNQSNETQPPQLTFDGNADEDLVDSPYVTGDANLSPSDYARDDEPDNQEDNAATAPASDSTTTAAQAPNPGTQATPDRSPDPDVEAAGSDADYEADDDIEPPDLGKLLSAANAARYQQNQSSRPGVDKQLPPQTIDEIMGRTSSRTSQQLGDLKQTNLDDYLRATGWPQTYENKKHDT